MKSRSLSRRLSIQAAGLLAVFGFVSATSAADAPLPPAPVSVYAAPATVGCATCSTCPGGAKCGPLRIHGKHSKPYETHLCPGGCFGYFQTQWHRWDDVCPLPYQVAGPGDGAIPPALPMPPTRSLDLKDVKPSNPIIPKKGNEVPAPRPIKSSGVAPLPPIPSVPAILPPPPVSRTFNR